MEEALNKGIPKAKSEFEHLLSEFKEQLSFMNENSDVITDKVREIQHFECHNPGPEGPERDEPINDGILGELRTCLTRMRIYNHSLNESKKALINLVG